MFEVVLCKRDEKGNKTDKQISVKTHKASVVGAFYFRNVVLPEQQKGKKA